MLIDSPDLPIHEKVDVLQSYKSLLMRKLRFHQNQKAAVAAQISHHDEQLSYLKGELEVTSSMLLEAINS